jgi:hypothetical protein
MKKRLLKFVLPISLGLMLSMITLFALISTTFVSCDPLKCAAGELKGNDGDCYACNGGGHTTYAYEGAGCSNPVSGVYCCPGGGSTGCQPKTGCPTWASWLGNNGHCYATSNECIAAQTGTTKKCRQCN